MNAGHYVIFCMYTIACLATSLFIIRRCYRLEQENAKLKKENYDLRNSITRAIDPRRADAWRIETENATKGKCNDG